MLSAAVSGDFDRVDNLYESLSDHIDGVEQRAEETPFSNVETLSEDLRRTRRRLDRTHAMTLLVRIETGCVALERSLEEGIDETALERYSEVVESYRIVRERVEQDGIDPCDRAELQTATDTASEGDAGGIVCSAVEEDEFADGVGRGPSPFDGINPGAAVAIAAHRIRAVSAAILDHAGEAYEAATEAEETNDRIEALEASRSLYRTVFYDCWSRPELLPGNPDQLRHRRERAVAKTIETHRQEADRRTAIGDEALWDGDTGEAIGEFDAALEHLEAAHELAETFPSGDRTEIESQWSQLENVRPEGVAGVSIRTQ